MNETTPNAAEKFTLLLATGFKLGYAPVASGTFGSLVGIPIVLALAPLHQLWWCQILICALLACLAVPVCETAERIFIKKDDGRIVADEWLILPISFIGLPLLTSPNALWLIPLCWVATRVFDIIKLPPAYKLQHLHGGIGIVIDDLFAALYALAANHLLFHFFG